MVEVFKTDVKHADHARMLLDQIHNAFSDYVANFDLDDCDKILRVESHKGAVEASHVVDIIRTMGFSAEVLPDDLPQLASA